MTTRHRIPTIFNLSMVDVLCCALGCVILLWLINLREAKNHEDESEQKLQETSSLLARTKTGLTGKLDLAGKQAAELLSRAATLEKDKAALLKDREAMVLSAQELDRK